MTARDDSSSSFALASISTELLRAELVARQDVREDGRPVCGSSSLNGTYNTSLHVGALGLILVLSTLACSFPIVARRFPKLPIPHRFLFLSRHFGTGVLIATAFVHLLPTAFVSLTDPCLPAFWTDGYPAMAGLVAMVSVMTVVGIEMFFAIRGAGHIHSAEYGGIEGGSGAEHDQEMGPPRKSTTKPPSLRPILRRFRTESFGTEGNPWSGDLAPDKPMLEKEARRSESIHRKESASDDDSDLELDEFDPTVQMNGGSHAVRFSDDNHSSYVDISSTRRLNVASSSSPATLSVPTVSRSRKNSTLSDATQKALDDQKLLLQCFLLEAGILFHSIFIGMALSVATGRPFVVLLIAISFHQTFEGLALGSRISAIGTFGPSSPKPWLMALAYGATTPIGQAIGLAVHNLYDPESQTGLLMVGFMNAISSGLLLFAGLVELLAEDFLSDQSYETLYGSKRLQACASVVAGSLLMALVGAWA